MLFFYRMDTHGCDKSHSYLRDTVWPNLRARTITKVDKNAKTGAEAQAFDDIDNLVLEILGSDSPTVAGLNVMDSVSVPTSSVEPIDCLAECFTEVPRPAGSTELTTLLLNTSSYHPTFKQVLPKSAPILPSAKKRKLSDNLADIKLLKQKLQVRKLKLDIIKLEKELSLEHEEIN